jgi:hypothetical protein
MEHYRPALLGPLALLAALVATGCRPGADPATTERQPPALFEDVTAASGVASTYRNGEEAGFYAILESLGGGVALLDYDGDGLLDVFVTGGGRLDGRRIRGYPSKLYKNLGGWRFRDVTAEAGLDGPLFYTHGCAVADYDRDGWPDLLVTGWGRLALYHNEPDGHGGRRFVEVTRKAGLTDTLWSSSAAWADLDGDGFPDLYICHYVNWSFQNDPACSSGTQRDVCPPKSFAALPHILYRNNGDGTFTDVSSEAGLRRDGKGLGVVAVDVNGDGKPDLWVANDTVDKFLYLNESTSGHIRLREVGLAVGVARDDQGAANGSMGMDAADYDGSGRPALWVTNYQHELHALYANLGNGRFLYSTPVSGIGFLGRSFVGFGTGFLDVDNDGWEDLVIANGHVLHHPPGGNLRQRPVLLRNQGRGRFADVSGQGGTYFRADHIGRGLAVGDLDNDGWPDVVISHQNEPVVLLRNVAAEFAGRGRQWLGVELVGRRHRDVVGARLTVEAGGRRLTRFARGGGSYLSSRDPRHLIGLGEADRVGRVTVDWPSGETQHWDGLAVDRYWRLIEGESAAR